MLISTVHAELDVSQIAGHSTALAARISRLPLEDPLPPDLKASERIRLPLSELWFPFHKPTVFPNGLETSGFTILISPLCFPLPVLHSHFLEGVTVGVQEVLVSIV
jgi:hypothetical protein